MTLSLVEGLSLETTPNSVSQNALQMLSYAVNLPGDQRNAIFRKYFNPEGEDIVQRAFERLVEEDATGAAPLKNIVVKAAPEVPREEAPGEMEDCDTAEPTITLNDDAW